jgi:hypothetical protein
VQSRTARHPVGVNGARAQPRLVARAQRTRPGGPAPRHHCRALAQRGECSDGSGRVQVS